MSDTIEEGKTVIWLEGKTVIWLIDLEEENPRNHYVNCFSNIYVIMRPESKSGPSLKNNSFRQLNNLLDLILLDLNGPKSMK